MDVPSLSFETAHPRFITCCNPRRARWVDVCGDAYSQPPGNSASALATASRTSFCSTASLSGDCQFCATFGRSTPSIDIASGGYFAYT